MINQRLQLSTFKLAKPCPFKNRLTSKKNYALYKYEGRSNFGCLFKFNLNKIKKVIVKLISNI